MTITTATIPMDMILERHILGILLSAGAEAMLDARAIIATDDFYTPAHAEIFRGLEAMLADGKVMDLAAVATDFRARGIMARVGKGDDHDNAEYLAQLADEYAPDPCNLAYYCRELKAKGILRRLITLGGRLAADAQRPAADAAALVESAQAELYQLTAGNVGRGEVADVAQAVAEAVEYADAVKRGEAAPGLMTGFAGIDRATGGMQAGDLWTLGGATSIGKTGFALTVAARVAEAGGAVFIVSAEMNRRSIANRLLAMTAGISGGRLRSGNLDEIELEAREAAQAKIAGWQLAILDRGATVAEIAARARLLAARWRRGLSLIVADYLQLLTPARADTRAQEVSGIAWGLKMLAMELGTPVLALSQLNRAGIRQADDSRPPALIDLKESGDLENHSNGVLLLHRPASAGFDNAGTLPVWAKVAKCRDGLTTPWPAAEGKLAVAGSIVLRFRPDLTRFEQ